MQCTPEGVPDFALSVWKLNSLSALKWSGIPQGCKRIVARYPVVVPPIQPWNDSPATIWQPCRVGPATGLHQALLRTASRLGSQRPRWQKGARRSNTHVHCHPLRACEPGRLAVRELDAALGRRPPRCFGLPDWKINGQVALCEGNGTVFRHGRCLKCWSRFKVPIWNLKHSAALPPAETLCAVSQ